MIDLHTSKTANGRKVFIALEELGLPYRRFFYDIFEGDQHTAEYGKINPNHRMPAIVDHDPVDGGPPFNVFESGACLQYLADKTGKLLTNDPRKRSVAIQWLTWQMAGLGPFSGQAAHFIRYAPIEIPYAIERYTKEFRRLMTVLERRLGEVEYVAGDEYTIADIAIFPGWGIHPNSGIALEDFPNTQRWHKMIGARPAVSRIMNDPEIATPKKYAGIKQVLNEHEWSNMFGENLQNAVKL